MTRRMSAVPFGLALGLFLYTNREWWEYVDLGPCIILLVIWGLCGLGYYWLYDNAQEEKE